MKLNRRTLLKSAGATLDTLGAIPWTLGPDQLLATIKQELARWTPIVKASDAKVD